LEVVDLRADADLLPRPIQQHDMCAILDNPRPLMTGVKPPVPAGREEWERHWSNHPSPESCCNRAQQLYAGVNAERLQSLRDFVPADRANQIHRVCVTAVRKELHRYRDTACSPPKARKPPTDCDYLVTASTTDRLAIFFCERSVNEPNVLLLRTLDEHACGCLWHGMQRWIHQSGIV
jgi:hypothetical protein